MRVDYRSRPFPPTRLRKTSEPILVYATAAKVREAKKICAALLKERVIACANILKSTSMYRWKGKLVRSREAVMILKTDRKHMLAITNEIHRLGSYDCPCVVELPIRGGSKKYLKWAAAELS